MNRNRHALPLVFVFCFVAALLVAPAALAAPSGEKCGSGFGTSVSAPSGLKLLSKTDTSAELKWSAPRNHGNVAQYNVYRDGVLAGSTPGTSFSDMGLTPNTDYVWTVKAVDKSGRLSAASNKLAAATPIVIREDTTWAAETAPPDIKAGLTVESGATLWIDAGVVLKIRPCQSVTVYGYVNAAGTPDALVVFTSTKDKAYGGCGVGSSGYWETVNVASGGFFTGNYMKIIYGRTLATVQGDLTLDNAELAYAKTQGVYVAEGGSFNGTFDKLHDCCEVSACKGIVVKGHANLSNSEIYDCPGTGVVVEATGSFNGTAVKFSNCGKGVLVKGSVNFVLCGFTGCGYGLYFDTPSFNGIIQNTFMGNNEYGVYNKRAQSVTIDAQENYWGSAGGPSVYDAVAMKWVGDGDRVSAGVLYDNWLAEPAQ